MFKLYEARKRFSLFRKAVYLAEIFHLVSLWSVIQTILTSNYYSINLDQVFFEGVSEYVNFSILVTSLLLFSLIFLIVSMTRSQNRFFYVGAYISLTLFYEVIGPVLDGGNNLSLIVIFFLCFTNENKRGPFEDHLVKLVSWVVIFQVSIMYFTAGCYKILSPLWRNGTALFYVLTSVEYSTPLVAKICWILGPIPFVLPSYLILGFQLFFPAAIFNKKLKYLFLGVGTIFHVSIGIFVGLPTFAMNVFATYFVFLLTIEDDVLKCFKDWTCQIIKNKFSLLKNRI